MKWCFFPFGGEKKVRTKLISKVNFNKDKNILDMCCGTGNTTFTIAQKVNNDVLITGIDLSEGQIKIAKKKNYYQNIKFEVMDATKTVFPDNAFNKIIIPHAIHEMNRETRLIVLKEAYRILKKAGTIILLEMDNPPNIFIKILIGFIWFYWLPFNFETPTRRDMLKHGLENEVKEAGFINITKENMFNGVFQVIEGNK
jgi:demethylmenaquinone methyltransferase/2-methoxy-6-polyprenyl-1,4-benzoquinol methylase